MRLSCRRRRLRGFNEAERSGAKRVDEVLALIRVGLAVRSGHAVEADCTGNVVIFQRNRTIVRGDKHGDARSADGGDVANGEKRCKKR